LSGVDPELKAKLKISTRTFEDALARNGAAVEALKVLTEGLVKAIADEAARQQQSQSRLWPRSQTRRRLRPRLQPDGLI
jgi:hypothetical protein